jgi:enoyl-CoA hydratase
MPVTWQPRDNVALVVIDNPPVNALNAEIINGLENTFDEIGQNPALRAVVVTGAGAKAFVAGADINQFIPLDGDGGYALVRRGVAVFKKIADFPYPVVCVLDGFTLGGGLELALACDIRLVEPQARLGLPEIGLGIIPGYGGTQRLPRLIGAGMAKKLVFSGQPINGEEAFRIGLAQQLLPTGGALEAALGLAAAMAANAPIGLKTAKSVINKGMDTADLDEAIGFESEGIRQVFQTEDKKEGVDAFVNKRKPVFKGR